MITFEPYRALTYAERKVNFLAIKTMQANLSEELDQFLGKIKEKLLS